MNASPVPRTRSPIKPRKRKSKHQVMPPGPWRCTPKQDAFVTAYLSNGFKAELAAKSAGYAFPRVCGYRLLDSDAVRTAINDELRRRKLTAPEIEARLAEIARSSPGDFINESGVNWKAVKSSGHLLRKIKVGKAGSEVETHSALEALTLAAKISGLLRDGAADTNIAIQVAMDPSAIVGSVTVAPSELPANLPSSQPPNQPNQIPNLPNNLPALPSRCPPAHVVDVAEVNTATPTEPSPAGPSAEVVQPSPCGSDTPTGSVPALSPSSDTPQSA